MCGINQLHKPGIRHLIENVLSFFERCHQREVQSIVILFENANSITDDTQKKNQDHAMHGPIQQFNRRQARKKTRKYTQDIRIVSQHLTFRSENILSLFRSGVTFVVTQKCYFGILLDEHTILHFHCIPLFSKAYSWRGHSFL